MCLSNICKTLANLPGTLQVIASHYVSIYFSLHRSRSMLDSKVVGTAAHKSMRYKFRLGTRRSLGRTRNVCRWCKSCLRRLYVVSSGCEKRGQKTYKYRHQQSKDQRQRCKQIQAPYEWEGNLGMDQAAAGCSMSFVGLDSFQDYSP